MSTITLIRTHFAPLGLRRLPLKAGAIYAGSLFTQRAIAALMLPLYISTLGAAQYGEVAVVASLYALAVGIMGFGMEAAIMRSYFQLASQPQEQRAYLSTVGVFLLVAPAVLAVAGILVTVFYAPWERDVLAVGFLGAALQTGTSVFTFAVLRAEERPSTFAWLNISYSVVFAILLIIFVVVLDGRAFGWFLANLVAWTVLLPDTVRVLARYWTPHLSAHHLKLGLLFSLPLVPHTLAHWSLTFSDRLVLSAWVSQAEVGIYSAGYQVAAVLGMLLVGVTWALMPQYSRFAGGTLPLSALRPLIVSHAAIALFLSAACAVLLPSLLRLLLPSVFDESARVAIWVIVGYCFLGLYHIPMNVLSQSLGETKWIWVGTVVAVIANLGFNLATVPRYGIEAAAIGTAVGYAALFVVMSAYLMLRLRSRKQMSASVPLANAA